MKTSNKIENSFQLRAEILRLKNVAEDQKQQVKNDVKAIREDLKPENILWNSLASITGMKISKSNFFKESMANGFSVFIQRFILKTENKIEDKVYDFVDTLFEKVKNFLNKFSSSEAKREERKGH